MLITDASRRGFVSLLSIEAVLSASTPVTRAPVSLKGQSESSAGAEELLREGEVRAETGAETRLRCRLSRERRGSDSSVSGAGLQPRRSN